MNSAAWASLLHSGYGMALLYPCENASGAALALSKSTYEPHLNLLHVEWKVESAAVFTMCWHDSNRHMCFAVHRAHRVKTKDLMRAQTVVPSCKNSLLCSAHKE